MTAVPPLVLASASPRRAAILAQLGLEAESVPADVDETHLPGESPVEHVERLALAKAAAVARSRPESLVVGGDTVVVLDGRILGKPATEDEAVGMLLSLAGRTHHVHSGVAVVGPGGGVAVAGAVRADVRFRDFGADEARAYVRSGEPMDKAGAYGIQGLGAALVEAVRGDYYCVVGLPVATLLELLGRAGWRYAFGRLTPVS